MFLDIRTFPTKEDGSFDIQPVNYTDLPPFIPPAHPSRSLQPDIIACSLITWTIAGIFVGARFYCRGKILRVLGPEDWLILLALIASTGLSGSALEQALRGAGQHWYLQDWYQGLPIQRAAWYGILFYWLSLEFTKLSILMLYRRFFTVLWAKRLNYLVLAITFGVGIYLVVTISTACSPVEAFWNWALWTEPGVTCRTGTTWWVNAGLHIFTDVIIFLLPLPVLAQLRLPRRQKIALFGVFMLGFFIVVVSIFRLWYLINSETHPSLDNEGNIDAAYDVAFICWWTSIETNGAICCACVVTLKPLAMRLFPTLLARPRSAESPADVVAHYANGPNSPELPGSDGRGRVPTVGSRPTRLRLDQHLDHSMVDPDEEAWIQGLDDGAREKARREADEAGEDALTSPTLVEDEKEDSEGLKRVETAGTVEGGERSLTARSITPSSSRDMEMVVEPPAAHVK